MTPTEIKSALAQLGGWANKKLGQHFLIDASALRAIVDAADIKKGDLVLEIGPGLGVLTNALMSRGAEVVAVEQDRRFVTDHGSPITDHLRIIHGDAARMEWDELIGNRSWKFVSNLPYSITSLALRKALWSPNPPSVVLALVQREVAERAIAKNKKTSLLSLMVALASREARIVKRVPAGAFYPPPKVESAILKITPMTHGERRERWGIEPEKIMSVARRGFAHPRKLLFSNLGISDVTRYTLHASRLARAEDLSPDQWAELTKAFFIDSLRWQDHEPSQGALDDESHSPT